MIAGAAEGRSVWGAVRFPQVYNNVIFSTVTVQYTELVAS